ARGDDDLLLAAGDGEEAVVVEQAEVTGAEPAVLGERLLRRRLVLVVAAEDVVTPEQDLLVLGDLDAAARQLQADGADLGRRRAVHAGRRRRLGEAVALENLEAQAAVEVAQPLAERAAARDR